MFNLFRSMLTNREIEVEFDNSLIPHLRESNNVNIIDTQKIQINLFKLIRAVGTIQTRRENPSNLQKIIDKSDLLDWIKNTDEFRIKKHPDTDKQISISEDLGVGLAVLIADHFFKIKWSTLGKIPRISGSYPDIRCFSDLGMEIVIEAKGTINSSFRNNVQKPDARNKKNNITADINIASCALLNENSITNVEYLDPPHISPEDKRYAESLLRADHYTRFFNLIGQKELSKYFNLMRKRIINDRNFKEFTYKQELYFKIKSNYLKINRNNVNFLGNIEQHDKNSFIFIGIDEKLLSLNGFVDFQDYAEDFYIKEGNNEFYITSDGIIFGLLKNLKFIKNQIKAEIHHYFDFVTIADLDSMKENTIIEFFEFIFKNIGCKIIKSDYENRTFDLNIEFENKKIAIEFKKSIKSNIEAMEQLQSFLNADKTIHKAMLITLGKLKSQPYQVAKRNNILIIDREALKKIIKNHKLFLNYLK